MSKRPARLGPQPSSSIFHRKTMRTVSRGRTLVLAVFLADLQRLDAVTLDKAVGVKVKFYPAQLEGWARVRRTGEVDQG